MEAYSVVGRTMDLYVVARTCLLKSLQLRPRNPRVHEALAAVAWVCFSQLKVVAKGHTKISGPVCDMKALTVWEVVGLSAVSLACRDSQHHTLIRMKARLPCGFPVLQCG